MAVSGDCYLRKKLKEVQRHSNNISRREPIAYGRKTSEKAGLFRYL